MKIEYLTIREGRIVLEKWQGTVSHHGLLEHEHAQLQDTRIQSGAVCLADCRDAVFPESNVQNIHELADLHSRPDNKITIAKIAVLVSDSNDWVTGKQLEVDSMVNRFTVILFNSISVACTWLGVEEDEVEEHLAVLKERLEAGDSA